jgi:glycosyltransferase involved in cell wall biosynthesis
MSTVSVIIPNYNGARFLCEAIDSALRQTGVVVEVIVVDDGSTDDSRVIMESYGDRISIILQKNQGACTARNAGLALAQGEYVMFLDSDDQLYPEVLARMSLSLDTMERDVALYGNARWMKGEELLLHDNTQLPAGMNAVAGLSGQNILTGRVLHRTENVRAVGGFNIRLPRGQEFDLHFRSALHGVEFIHFAADVLNYRIHLAEHRISAKGFSGDDSRYFLQLNETHEQLLNQKYGSAWPDQVRVRMAKRLWEIGRGLIREENQLVAYEYFTVAQRLSPKRCVSGGIVYRFISRFIQPLFAERVVSVLRIISMR